jgi:hypothetical protein
VVKIENNSSCTQYEHANAGTLCKF